MDSFAGKLAVVTGGGSGIGRELVRLLAAEGCSVAACDLNPGAVTRAATDAEGAAPDGVRVTGHACDVSDEDQVLGFRDELLHAHDTDHVDLVFANAGIGGGASFVTAPREQWERVFAVDWWGVYYCARAFLPLLIASGDGVLVNTSSVNGLWATLGPGSPQTAYAAAKFAVRGFTEALIEDLRVNAPQVRVALVMPGHIGTDIVANTRRALGMPDPGEMTSAQLDLARAMMAARLGEGAAAMPDDAVRQMITQTSDNFRDGAPVSAAQAAAVILDGVRAGEWRILVGQDAKNLDALIRARPESAYDYAELGLGRLITDGEPGAENREDL